MESKVDAVMVLYKNHRGEVAWRTIEVWRHDRNSTEHHPKKQDILVSWDFGKEDLRDFALRDILAVRHPLECTSAELMDLRARIMAANGITDTPPQPTPPLQAAPAPTPRFDAAALTRGNEDWQLRLNMALLSQLAYADPETIEATGVEWGLETCEVVEANSTRAIVASTPAAVVVAFRGSANLGNWLANLRVLSTDYRDGRVHRGFYYAYADVRGRLESRLDDFWDRPLFLTGHSLGGAMALLAAEEIYGGDIECGGVHTFGQPALCDASMSRVVDVRFAGLYLRYVNDDDIVPRVPPGYTHCGQLVHFRPDGGVEPLRSLAGQPEAPATMTPEAFAEIQQGLRAEQWSARRAMAYRQTMAEKLVHVDPVPQQGWFPSIRDHAIGEYVQKVAAKVVAP